MAEVEALPPLAPALAPNAAVLAAQLGQLALEQSLEQSHSPSEQQTASPPGAPSRQPIHERHTACSRLHALVDPESESAAAIKALLRIGEPRPGPAALPQLGAGATEYARRHGESIRDLVARKRQIFLAQMSLDTKHSEIAKLEQRSRQWEEALAASEAALDADSQRFEEYLKENDAKLQEALRRAEAEARARAEKAAEAKRLAAAIAALRSEMGKMEEQLEECKTLKAFLDSVTPQEWFEGLAAQRDSQKAALRAAWQEQCDAIAARKREAAAAQQRAENDMQWARTQQQFERAERAQREAAAALREALAEQDPPEPDYGVLDVEEEGLHFRDPSQLLAVFSQLQGSNMFQIQTAQDAESAVEAARADHAATTAALDADAAGLRRQVAELEAGVAASRERSARLQAAARQSLEGGGGGVLGRESSGGSVAGAGGAGSASGGGGGSHPQVQPLGLGLGPLSEAVAAAYEAAGFARDASVTPLQMLQKLEGRLEEWLAALGPPGGPVALLAEQVERGREKERRQAARADKLAARQAEHESRVARVLARAAAPKFQKSGKPAMTRSVLQREERGGGGERDDDAEEELRAFLALVDEAIPADQ